MANTRLRALRVFLLAFSLLAAAGGLALIFGGRPFLMRMFLHPPESEMSTLFLFMVKELGGAVLAFSLMLYFAYRDPVRNVAIINAVIVGLCILAFTPLLSLYTLDIRALYPASLVLVRTVVRLVVAALLLYLRPRQASVDQG
ncbi:MAG: hypothetical protein ABSA70_00765 [Terriglobia bacterium]